MCKFCKPDEFGDGIEITKPIKSKEVRIGSVFNAMTLEAWILDGEEGNDLVHMNITLRYCPKCGRKLIN